MRQRDVHLVGHARVFDQVPVGRIDVVGPHGQAQRPDHRHGSNVGRERFHDLGELGRGPGQIEDEVVG